MKLNHLLAIVFSLAMFSCSTSRSPLTYFENIKTQQDGEIPAPSSYQIKIVPDDELLITVTSLIPEATAEYNLPLSNPAKNGSLLEVTQPKQQTYLVDKTGDIDFPRLGTIHVAGMTTAELQNLLAKKISVDVEDPVVKVSLINFRINVLGEVRNPGTIGVNRERFSILDALGAAGDLTEYAERTMCFSSVKLTERRSSTTSTLTTRHCCRRPTTICSRTTPSTWSLTKSARTTPSTIRTTPSSCRWLPPSSAQAPLSPHS